MAGTLEPRVRPGEAWSLVIVRPSRRQREEERDLGTGRSRFDRPSSSVWGSSKTSGSVLWLDAWTWGNECTGRLTVLEALEVG